MTRSIWLLVIFFSFNAAALSLPTEIQKSQLDTMIETLGYSTSSKFLSNPYPLGGYSGLEVGVSMEIIDIEEISRLGTGTSSQSEFRYNRITVGKGLYKNVDAYAHFVPYSSSNKITDFGGLFRWCFFEGKYLPFSASVLAHLNTMNIQDSFVNQNTGLDFMMGVNVNRLALYLGGGYLRARTIFTTDILDSTDPEFTSAGGVYKLTTSSPRSFVGVQVQFEPFFIIGEIDRYDEPVYSVKIGYRN